MTPVARGADGPRPLPAPSAATAAAKVVELTQQARDLHFAALRHRKRDSEERVSLLQRAISVLMRALALDEQNAETRAMLGNWLARPELGTDAMKRAAEELLRARRDDGTGAMDYEISSQLGIAYSHLGRFQDAIGEYDRALRLLPGEPDQPQLPRRLQQATLLGNSAEALMAVGRLEEAIRRYAQAESLDQSDQGALHALGLAIAYDRDGQQQKSREALTRSLTADPGLRLFQSDEVFFAPEGDRFYYEGLINEALDKNDEALRAFQEFVRQLPRSRYAARAREHIDELRQRPGLGYAELLRAQVTIGAPHFPPTDEGGGTNRHRSEIEVEKIVRAHSLELRQCYARALHKSTRLAGDLLLAVIVDRDGAVLISQPLRNKLSDQRGKDAVRSWDSSTADADVPQGPGAVELTKCVQGTILRWRFAPADPEDTTNDEFALPMRFSLP